MNENLENSAQNGIYHLSVYAVVLKLYNRRKNGGSFTNFTLFYIVSPKWEVAATQNLLHRDEEVFYFAALVAPLN